ncbi:MAG: acetylglutamate kinase [Planctomycetes bacterium]|nr:acetylglutamate kinase [Planctomycetota bacterium]
MFRHHHANIAWGLKEALPFVRLFRDKVFVVKAGGELFGSEEALRGLVGQVALLHELGIRVVLAHGGGPQTSDLSRRLGLEPQMHQGRRITDRATLDACKMSLNGQLGTDIVAALRGAGVPACRISGVDGGLITARARAPQTMVSGELIDWGEVGDVVAVDARIIERLHGDHFVPVLSPLSADENGRVLNVNADTVAAEVARALGAAKLIFLTSVAGVMEDRDDPSSLLSYLDLADLRALEESGAIRDGMLPKSRAIARALEGGVERVHVISYLMEDSLVLEVFTNEGCGTLIERVKKTSPAGENASAGEAAS